MVNLEQQAAGKDGLRLGVLCGCVAGPPAKAVLRLTAVLPVVVCAFMCQVACVLMCLDMNVASQGVRLQTDKGACGSAAHGIG